VTRTSDRVKEAAYAEAARLGRPVQYLESSVTISARPAVVGQLNSWLSTLDYIGHGFVAPSDESGE
jgi:hypothetical protein